jgi:predicted protein tyrosine phosphatase
MTEIDENIFVGDMDDYMDTVDNPLFVFIQAAKLPFHKLAVGYKGTELEKNHPEYFVAVRKNGIALNMVDSDNPIYFNCEMFDVSLHYIDVKISEGKKILIHCNQGISRSPSIGLLYLAKKGKISNENYLSAKSDFEKIYPNYYPNRGVRDFLYSTWNKYIMEVEYER